MSYISMDDLRPELKDTIMDAYNQLKLTVIDEDFFFEPEYKDRGFYIVRANPEGTESLLPTRSEFFGIVSAGPFNDEIVYRTYIVVDHETGNMYTKSQTYEAPYELLRETDWVDMGNVTEISDDLVTDDSEKALSAKQGVVLKAMIDQLNETLVTKIEETKTDYEAKIKVVSDDLTSYKTETATDLTGVDNRLKKLEDPQWGEF